MARTSDQVELVLYKLAADGTPNFLLFKRAEARGGFWQSVTGGVEEGESFEEAARREVREETGITEFKKFFDTGYSFEFEDKSGTQKEIIFAAEIDDDTRVIISDEHSETAWATEEEAVSTYLKYPGNKEAIRQVAEQLRGQKA